MRLCLNTPKPCQNVGGKHGNPRACGYTGKSLFGAWFAMRELVTPNYDGDQACDFGNSACEKGLHCGESGIEWRLRKSNRRSDEEEREGSG